MRKLLAATAIALALSSSSSSSQEVPKYDVDTVCEKSVPAIPETPGITNMPGMPVMPGFASKDQINKCISEQQHAYDILLNATAATYAPLRRFVAGLNQYKYCFVAPRPHNEIKCQSMGSGTLDFPDELIERWGNATPEMKAACIKKTNECKPEHNCMYIALAGCIQRAFFDAAIERYNKGQTQKFKY